MLPAGKLEALARRGEVSHHVAAAQAGVRGRITFEYAFALSVRLQVSRQQDCPTNVQITSTSRFDNTAMRRIEIITWPELAAGASLPEEP